MSLEAFNRCVCLISLHGSHLSLRGTGAASCPVKGNTSFLLEAWVFGQRVFGNINATKEMKNVSSIRQGMSFDMELLSRFTISWRNQAGEQADDEPADDADAILVALRARLDAVRSRIRLFLPF